MGGFVPLSTTDWPGMLSAVVFLQGCAWHCRYCHNAHLRPPQSETEIPWRAVEQFLHRRRGLLDAIVFSGGEPTVQAGLPEAMRRVRELGYRVGLHTCGSHPGRLAQVLALTDWVGFDIKAPFADYAHVTGVPGSGERAQESFAMIRASGVEIEIRTTLHSALLDPHALGEIAHRLRDDGVTNWVIQNFRSAGCEDSDLLASRHEIPSKAVFAKVAGEGMKISLR